VSFTVSVQQQNMDLIKQIALEVSDPRNAKYGQVRPLCLVVASSPRPVPPAFRPVASPLVPSPFISFLGLFFSLKKGSFFSSPTHPHARNHGGGWAALIPLPPAAALFAPLHAVAFL